MFARCHITRNFEQKENGENILLRLESLVSHFLNYSKSGN